MSCGDPMCRCGCGSYLGQCRRAAERVDTVYKMPNGADSLQLVVAVGTELARVRSRLREYITDLEVYQQASETLYEAERGGAVGVRGYLGPGLEKLRQKLNVHQAWLKSFAGNTSGDGQ